MSKKDYILLTGGAGYIGSAICYYLLRDNKNVIIVDNYSNCHENNLKSLPNRDNLIVFNVDCCDYISMENIFKSYSISIIIHLAGLKAVGESIQYPMKYYENNLLSSITILKLTKQFSVKKFIFSSSATVYGNQLSPLSEETQTGCGITNPYGMTKYMIESMIQDFAKVNTLIDFVILRYFNPVGTVEHGLIVENPRDVPNNLMPVIVRNYLQNITINVFGNDYHTHDGTPARDFIHIEDLANGHIKAVEYHNHQNNISIFNLGTGTSYTVLDVIKKFEQVNNVRLNYIFSERRPGDLENVFCDPTKSNLELKWKAEKGLNEMCDFQHLI